MLETILTVVAWAGAGLIGGAVLFVLVVGFLIARAQARGDNPFR